MLGTNPDFTDSMVKKNQKKKEILKQEFTFRP